MAAIKSQTTVSGDLLAEPTYKARKDGKAPSLNVMLIYSPRRYDPAEQRYKPVDDMRVRVQIRFSGDVADRVRLLFDRGVLHVGLPVTAHGRLSDKPIAREYKGRIETSFVFHADDIDIDLVTLATRDPNLAALTPLEVCA
ncbi:hypothetical protein [Bifidobacterium miconisargentati]|uniref:hypothetical protein n=1 Tax=Bifidobacterium miconisargentati TaxID=2834437 RepID=UPI001BDBBC6D|nr:hypothetical protein [Bifidobacterium miconisargentati]MBW3089241.1 hypothetical protein [Bifidobacterium miconisargentati]